MSFITAHALDSMVGTPPPTSRSLSALGPRPSSRPAPTTTGESPTSAPTTSSRGLPDRLRHRRLLRGQEIDHFHPVVTIDFTVQAGQEHYHIPLLLSPFAYSTYRGS